jgi:Ser/Thr protein kinase RdoA (MazF antagonist)
MRGSLGEKLFEGASADIHAWAPGQVVKLFKTGFPRFLGEYETRMTRAVFAAGAPAPQVFEEVTLGERFGIVLSQFDGPTLLQLTRDGALTAEQAGAILASLALSVHRMPPPPETHALRGWMDAGLKASGSVVPKHIGTGILALIDRLRPEDGLCHGDLHHGNVIMTADGPRLIDWTCSIRAPAAFDLAWSHIALTELVAEISDNPQQPIAVDAAARSEYARLAGISPAELTAALELYMPIVIVRYFILLRGPTSARWERLMQHVEATLRAEC